MTTKDDKVMRSFDTGATRDTGEGKLDYEGFFSPEVLRQYARFMNMNRLQSDGKLRASDNWQKGIPMDVYMKSAYRHFMEFWEGHRAGGLGRWEVEFMASACGLLFNIMGYMHEYLKENSEIRFDADEPTEEMAERQAKIRLAKWDEAFEVPTEDIQKIRLAKWDEAFEVPTEDIQEEMDDWADNGFDDGGPDGPLVECPDCYEIYGENEDHKCREEDINDHGGKSDCGCADCGSLDTRPGQDMTPGSMYDGVEYSGVSKDFSDLVSRMQSKVEKGDDYCECESCTQVGEIYGDGPDGVLYPGKVQVRHDDKEDPFIDGYVCDNCRFYSRSVTEHPCDCCDEGCSNFSPEDD